MLMPLNMTVLIPDREADGILPGKSSYGKAPDSLLSPNHQSELQYKPAEIAGVLWEYAFNIGDYFGGTDPAAGVGTIQNKLFLPKNFPCCIDACNQPLGCRFLITGASIRND